MFERVLKRLCPCYFAKSEDKKLSEFPPDPVKSSDAKQTSGSSEKEYSHLSSSNSKTVSSTGSNVPENWKGTLNLVQPQPVYAFPIGGPTPLPD